MTQQHTKRPWEIVHRINGGYNIIQEPSEKLVCELYSDDNDKSKEDAHLIAAAPDMLAALEYAERELTAIYNQVSKHYIVTLGQFGRLETLRAAIAKARGQI